MAQMLGTQQISVGAHPSLLSLKLMPSGCMVMSSGSPASCTLSSLIDLVSGEGGGGGKDRKEGKGGQHRRGMYGALPRFCLPTAPGTIFDQGCMVMSSGSPAICNVSSLIDLEKSSRDAPAGGGGGKGALARVPPQLD